MAHPAVAVAVCVLSCGGDSAGCAGILAGQVLVVGTWLFGTSRA